MQTGYTGRTLLPMVDELAAKRAFEAGVGATIQTTVGGTLDPGRFTPQLITAKVRLLADGRFRSESFGEEWYAGPTAVLEVGGVKVIVVSLRSQTLDPEMIRFVGIAPERERILVVKSSIHYRAAFEPIAREIIEVDAPGLSSSNLTRFSFTNVRRPIFPLDPL